jgi:hypothetical protein
LRSVKVYAFYVISAFGCRLELALPSETVGGCFGGGVLSWGRGDSGSTDRVTGAPRLKQSSWRSGKTCYLRSWGFGETVMYTKRTASGGKYASWRRPF